MLRVDTGFYIGTILWAALEPYCTIHMGLPATSTVSDMASRSSRACVNECMRRPVAGDPKSRHGIPPSRSFLLERNLQDSNVRTCPGTERSRFCGGSMFAWLPHFGPSRKTPTLRTFKLSNWKACINVDKVPAHKTRVQNIL